MQPVRSNIERRHLHPLVEFGFHENSRETTDFGRLKLGKLFSLYGLDELTGERIENVLPLIVTENPEFKKRLNPEPIAMPAFTKQHPNDWLPWERETYNEYQKQHADRRLPFQVETYGRQYRITNFEQLSGQNLIKTLRFLFDIVGVNSESLVLEKKSGTWDDKTSPSDLLIPKRVVIETRNGKSAGLEFPMDGAVHTEAEIKMYIKNLWFRLGLIDRSEKELLEQAANETLIHLHWVPNYQSLSKPLRKEYYESQRNLFGDLNDKAMIDQYTNLANSASPSLSQAFDTFSVSLQQNPIMNLTRSTFRRVKITEDGMYEHNRRFRNGDMDPNFSNELKLLRYGLRGKYGQPTFGLNQPVPIVGIEFRNDGPLSQTTLQVRRAEAKFYKDSVDGPRGIEDDPARLEQRANDLGIDPRILTAIIRANETGDPRIKESSWKQSTVNATLLMPLTPWENHPLYIQGLETLKPEQRARAQKRFTDSRARYQKNINSHIELFYQTSDGIAFQKNVFRELMLFLRDSKLSTVMNLAL